MIDFALSDLEIAPPSVVRQAARDFAAALAETSQFQAFEAAADRLNEDQAANRAIEAFQRKQESLLMMLRLNALSAEDRAELQRLQQAAQAQPSVVAFLQAEADLKALCQMAGAQLSRYIGIDFAKACASGSSCC